jgi:mortality factor 4-like protein 1
MTSTSSSSSSSPEDDYHHLTPPPFRVDEHIYAIGARGDSHYPAVIRTARHQNNEWSFLVHYKGWNARFDQWMPARLILPETPENKLIFEQQQQQQQQQQPRSSIKKRKQEGSSSSARKRRKGKNDSHLLLYSDYCELPLTLKTVLMEEFEKITSSPERLLHCLPAPVPVRKLLKHFRKKMMQAIQTQQPLADKNTHPDKEETATAPTPTPTTEQQQQQQQHLTPENLQAFCQQLGQLFQDTLPVCLLYPEERPQYNALQKEEQRDSLLDLYGCEYLLRLVVRLPVLLQAEQHSWTTTTVIVGPLLVELLRLMQKNRQGLFAASKNYRPA